MAGAAPLKVTFFALEPRERGGVLARATLAYLGLGILIFALFAMASWRLFPPVFEWYFDMLSAIRLGEEGELSLREIPRELFLLMPSYFLLIFAVGVLFASYEAACLRWMIHGETAGLFGLSLGPDTWRVWLTYWAWMAGFLCIYVVFASAVFALVLGVSMIAGPAALAVTPLLLLGLYAALIVFAVRTAPAAATSVALKRCAFFKAWAVTRGRFWAMLGSFLLLWLIAVVIMLMLYTAGLATIFAASGVSFRDVMSAGDRHAIHDAIIAVMMTPRALTIAGAYYVLLVAFSLTLYVAMFGVNARAAKLALEEGRI